MTRFVILLRGVNVGGRSLPMAALKAAIVAAGYADCLTYIQSGNLILSADGEAADVETAIEAVIADSFAMRVEAIARPAAGFAAIVAANPFPEAAPNRLHLGLTKRPLNADAVETLLARAQHGERIALAGGALWIDFVEGVGASRLMPAILDKAAGSTLTARNLNTLRKLVEMAAS